MRQRKIFIKSKGKRSPAVIKCECVRSHPIFSENYKTKFWGTSYCTLLKITKNDNIYSCEKSTFLMKAFGGREREKQCSVTIVNRLSILGSL